LCPTTEGLTAIILAVTAAAVLLAVLVGSVNYRWIELPGLQKGRILAQRIEQHGWQWLRQREPVGSASFQPSSAER
jgi:peptidoglycan/LPS O-acetylase OafA/YrhL